MLAFVHLVTFFVVAPIFNSMIRIDRVLIEAAYDCGASSWQTLTQVIIPLAKPGIIETNLMKYGLSQRCARVRAAEVPVLSLDDPTSQASLKSSEEIERAKSEDRAEAVVLGCAGMADLAARRSKQHGLPPSTGWRAR